MIKDVIRNLLRMSGNVTLEHKLYRMMWKLHLDSSSIQHWSDNPTTMMLDARQYYECHSDEVNDIENFLEDEISRKLYLQSINFRQTWKREDMPVYTEDNQYIVDGIVRLSDTEVFVNCGAYTGDTIEAFMKKVNGKYKAIVAFEPDDNNYMDLKKKLQKREWGGITTYNYGVWSRNDVLSFDMTHSEGSRITESGKKKIKVVSIDDISECRDASFISMDVEGAELEALKGAKITIQKNHPQLAISIYHSSEDMIEIPIWIHENFPDYRLYVRVHSLFATDVILYAIA